MKERNLIQMYEIDNLKHATNKDFLILNGPGVLQSDESAAKIVKKTIAHRTSVDVDLTKITEAVKIPVKNPRNTKESLILKFKSPYDTRVEVTNKLVSKKPDIYLNEALSPLKGGC